MAEVKVRKVVDVKPQDAWNAIRAIGGLDRWFPVIAKRSVQGQGVGAKRVCELANGVTLVERVEQIDDAAQVFKYAITDAPLPIRNYLGTVRVRDAGAGKSEIVWSAAFDVEEADREEMVGMLSGAFADGITGLESDLKTSK
jgi:hypothetical protein